uniref:alpha/beta hydrolase family protein n=1 Tax=Pontiella sp. TaxID=2837462 RepID=UPI003563FFF3
MKTWILAGCAALAVLSPANGSYDPLAITQSNSPTPLDLVVKDETRGRSIPVLVYLPETTNAAPVVLFSHGLGGSRTGNAYLGKHWSARGYVAVFVQHPGSDDGTWKNAAPRDRMKVLEKAASGSNYLLRVKDIPAVLDQLETWNQERNHALRGRMDLEHIGMSGHSFGAVTTQAVSGQTAAGGRLSATDARIKAACAFSPSSPRA